MTTVAYIGNFRHPFCTEAYVARALEANGCTVVGVQQEHADEWPSALDIGACDLVLYTRIHNSTALNDQWTRAWKSLADRGIVTASLHLDRFWDLEREQAIHDRDPLFTTQHVFTADGGNDDRWHAAGVNHHWMPPAVDRAEAEREPSWWADREPPWPTQDFDVVFVGSTCSYHVEYPQRLDLLAFLRDRYGSRFATFGSGADYPVVREQELTDVYRSAKVIVGDSCFANDPAGIRTPRRATKYWSDRIPETLGRGGFLIHAWTPGMAEHFTTGRDLVTHVPGDWEDLDAQIGAYLAAPGEREAIAAEGRRRVLREHTWDVRMRDVLCTVGLGECDKPTKSFSGNVTDRVVA